MVESPKTDTSTLAPSFEIALPHEKTNTLRAHFASSLETTLLHDSLDSLEQTLQPGIEPLQAPLAGAPNQHVTAESCATDELRSGTDMWHTAGLKVKAMNTLLNAEEDFQLKRAKLAREKIDAVQKALVPQASFSERFDKETQCVKRALNKPRSTLWEISSAKNHPGLSASLERVQVHADIVDDWDKLFREANGGTMRHSAQAEREYAEADLKSHLLRYNGDFKELRAAVSRAEKYNVPEKELRNARDKIKEEDSLFQLMDYTSTPFGYKLLRQWVTAAGEPGSGVRARHKAIEYFVQNPTLSQKLRRGLAEALRIPRSTHRKPGERRKWMEKHIDLEIETEKLGRKSLLELTKGDFEHLLFLLRAFWKCTELINVYFEGKPRDHLPQRLVKLARTPKDATNKEETHCTFARMRKLRCIIERLTEVLVHVMSTAPLSEYASEREHRRGDHTHWAAVADHFLGHRKEEEAQYGGAERNLLHVASQGVATPSRPKIYHYAEQEQYGELLKQINDAKSGLKEELERVQGLIAKIAPDVQLRYVPENGIPQEIEARDDTKVKDWITRQQDVRLTSYPRHKVRFRTEKVKQCLETLADREQLLSQNIRRLGARVWMDFMAEREQFITTTHFFAELDCLLSLAAAQSAVAGNEVIIAEDHDTGHDATEIVGGGLQAARKLRAVQDDAHRIQKARALVAACLAELTGGSHAVFDSYEDKRGMELQRGDTVVIKGTAPLTPHYVPIREAVVHTREFRVELEGDRTAEWQPGDIFVLRENKKDDLNDLLGPKEIIDVRLSNDSRRTFLMWSGDLESGEATGDSQRLWIYAKETIVHFGIKFDHFSFGDLLKNGDAVNDFKEGLKHIFRAKALESAQRRAKGGGTHSERKLCFSGGQLEVTLNDAVAGLSSQAMLSQEALALTKVIDHDFENFEVVCSSISDVVHVKLRPHGVAGEQVSPSAWSRRVISVIEKVTNQEIKKCVRTSLQNHVHLFRVNKRFEVSNISSPKVNEISFNGRKGACALLAEQWEEQGKKKEHDGRWLVKLESGEKLYVLPVNLQKVPKPGEADTHIGHSGAATHKEHYVPFWWDTG